jgi:hypothetical protein
MLTLQNKRKARVTSYFHFDSNLNERPWPGSLSDATFALRPPIAKKIQVIAPRRKKRSRAVVSRSSLEDWLYLRY